MISPICNQAYTNILLLTLITIVMPKYFILCYQIVNK